MHQTEMVTSIAPTSPRHNIIIESQRTSASVLAVTSRQWGRMTRGRPGRLDSSWAPGCGCGLRDTCTPRGPGSQWHPPASRWSAV